MVTLKAVFADFEQHLFPHVREKMVEVFTVWRSIVRMKKAARDHWLETSRHRFGAGSVVHAHIERNVEAREKTLSDAQIRMVGGGRMVNELNQVRRSAGP